ncbi:MAG TPA: fused MFS/spermidine synthase [Terriglobia bacterium]|nr:fused MFS/spermidine synthase [Terriglobia bacterium]
MERRYLPILVLLFIGSGCAALIYEIVWFQILELVIGSSSISLGILLGTFMGGMCLGSLLAPRVIPRTHHPLRVYAALEIGIAIIGLLILLGVPLIRNLHASRAILAAVCLLPPTMLMGATLPAISRWVKTTPEGVAWLGFFYGGNIGGAVLGSLLTGFYLLRVYDIVIATLAAIAINFAVAGLSLLLAKATPYVELPDDEPFAHHAPEASAVYVTIAISGFTALAAEVIFTRLLSLLFGATVYTFSLILAVFLLGLGIGSSLGSFVARKSLRPAVALGSCQLLLCGAIAWAAWLLLQSMPVWPVNVTLNNDPWLKVQFDAARTMWAVFPGALLWGASFPLALASLAARGQDPGRLVGGLYAANTLGAIAGSLLSSLVLVSTFGVQHSLRALIAVSAVAALMVLTDSSQSQAKLIFTMLIAVVVTGIFVVSVPALSPDFVAYGRFVPTMAGQTDVVYVGEGMMAFVAVSKTPEGSLKYHNAGKVQASSDPADMRLQRMLGHLTTLIPKDSKNFLVIGLGSGVTAGAVSLEPRLERETVIEIEPLVPKVVASHFSAYNFDVTANEKVSLEIDDGRHYLMTTDQKFDGITSDPLDPWVKGSAALYSKEFFEAAKAHLSPGGVVTQWMQLYQTNEEAVKSEIATFFEVFPSGIIWVNNIDGRGYDLVLMGQAEPTRIDIDALATRVESPEYAVVAKSLREIGFQTTTDLLATFAGQATDFRPWLRDAAINTDRNLRLQYLAGFGLNLYRENQIYRNMVAHGPRMPKDLFTGSQSSLDGLAKLIETGRFR